VNVEKNLDGFLDALDVQIEGAVLHLNDPQAFVEASRAIERLLTECWPAIQLSLRENAISNKDRQRVQQTLDSINSLEAKTRARLAWSEDFELHMRRAMETTS